MQGAALDARQARKDKLVCVLAGMHEDVKKQNRCAVCVVLDYTRDGFPVSETSRVHNAPISCRLKVNGKLLTDSNSPFVNEFRPVLNRLKPEDHCWKCFLHLATPDHIVKGTGDCKFDNIAKPILYALFYLEDWRNTVFPRHRSYLRLRGHSLHLIRGMAPQEDRRQSLVEP